MIHKIVQGKIAMTHKKKKKKKKEKTNLVNVGLHLMQELITLQGGKS